MDDRPGYASACVLSFERPAFLRECISTLLEHADAPLELIVHDDGSHDVGVHTLLHDWVRDGVLSTLITNPPGHNQGQGTALNRMFGMATGDPILKLDQDLVFKPGWLRRVNELLESNRTAASWNPWSQESPAEPWLGLLALMSYEHEPVDYRKTVIARFDGWSSHSHILGSAFAMSREAWEHFGPFGEHSEAFAEDYEMQRLVSRSREWVCGLADEDLVSNQGFGIGPSTVVVAEGQVQPIKKEPVIHG